MEAKKELPSRNELLARFIALEGVRSARPLEQLHRGIIPSSQTGDFSDVKVVSPFGEVPWNEVSRISECEMRELMLAIEAGILKVLESIPKLEALYENNWEVLAPILYQSLYEAQGVSWDLSEEQLIKRHGSDFVEKLKRKNGYKLSH